MKKNACGKTHKVIIIIDTSANEKYPSWKSSSWKMQGVNTRLTGSFKILGLDVSQFSLFYTLHFTKRIARYIFIGKFIFSITLLPGLRATTMLLSIVTSGTFLQRCV